MCVGVACPKGFYSGERRELREASEKTREDWRLGRCLSIFPRLFRAQFSAPLPLSSRHSPLSECLEQLVFFRGGGGGGIS